MPAGPEVSNNAEISFLIVSHYIATKIPTFSILPLLDPRPKKKKKKDDNIKK